MGNTCCGGSCCSRAEGEKRMSKLTENQKRAKLANDSTCIGVLLVIYRIFVLLFIAASVIPNFAVQRDPVAGADPTLFRFDALPHVIFMIVPIIMFGYAERARLMSLYADRRAAKNLVRRTSWIIFFLILDMLASGVHFAGFLIEGITQSSPLTSNPNTQAFVWVGLGFTLIQFLMGLWLLVKFCVFKSNLHMALKLSLPFAAEEDLETGKQPERSASVIIHNGNRVAGLVGSALRMVGFSEMKQIKLRSN